MGDGRERKRLQVLAEQLGVADKVHFWGFLSRSETLQKLSEYHILVHPSLHDSGGNVCLEAMAVGRPIICLNLRRNCYTSVRGRGLQSSRSDP